MCREVARMGQGTPCALHLHPVCVSSSAILVCSPSWHCATDMLPCACPFITTVLSSRVKNQYFQNISYPAHTQIFSIVQSISCIYLLKKKSKPFSSVCSILHPLHYRSPGFFTSSPALDTYNISLLKSPGLSLVWICLMFSESKFI